MEKPSTVEDAWFVLSTSNPRQAEYCLTEQNVMDDKEGRAPSFRSFVPYTYIEPAAKGKEADDKLSLRAALRRYFFVQGDEQRLETVIRRANATHEDKAFFLRNGTKKKASISHADMEKLIDACSDNDANFDLPVSLDDIKVGNTFNLAHTPFESKDARYTIVSVHKKKDGSVQIQLELTMFNVTFRRLFVTYNETVDTKRHAEFVTTAQKKLLDILKRKVNGKETEVSRYLDEKTLRDIFAKRSLPIADGPMRRHFLALMLFCILSSQHSTQCKSLTAVGIVGNGYQVGIAVVAYGMYTRHFATTDIVYTQILLIGSILFPSLLAVDVLNYFLG